MIAEKIKINYMYAPVGIDSGKVIIVLLHECISTFDSSSLRSTLEAKAFFGAPLPA